MLETMPLGEIAAILTAVCWSVGSMLFTVTGRKIGSSSVNQLRLWLAFVLLIPIHYIILGSFFPFDADPSNLAWLGFFGPPLWASLGLSIAWFIFVFRKV